MAVQILPEQGLGESLGAGLAQGLQGLAQLKAQDLMRRQQAAYNVPLLQGLLPGVQGQQLQQLAMADPALLNQLIQQQRQMQRGSMLAGLYGDQRLAGLTPQEIQAYVSSPQYQRQAVRQETQAQAQPIISNLTQLIKQGVGSNVLTSYLSKRLGLAGSDFNALVTQLKAFKDPQLQALAGGLQEAKTDRARREILAGYLQNNPNQVEEVGQILSNVTGGVAGGLGQQAQEAATSPIAAQNMQEAMAELTPAPARTLGQQVTGVAQEAAKSFPKLLEQETPQQFQERVSKIERDVTSPEYSLLREGIEGLPIGQDILSQGISSLVAKPAAKAIETVAEFISPGSTQSPEGIIETAARNTAKNAPLLALTGSFNPVGLATDFTASLGGEVAKDVGFGTAGQTVAAIGAGILGSKGFNALARKLKGVKPTTTIGDFKKELYEEAEKAGTSPTIRAQTLGSETEKGIVNKLNDVEEKARRVTVGEAFKDYEKKQILDNIDTTRSNLLKKQENNLLSPNALAEELRDINKNYVQDDTALGRLYKDYRGAIADALEDAGKTNPGWYSKWKPANELHSIENWKSSFTAALNKFKGDKIVDKIFSNPALLYTMPFMTTKKAGALLTGATLGKIVDKTGQGYSILRFAMNNPQGQELLNRLVRASATNDGGLIKRSLLDLDKFYRKNEGALKRQVGEAATLQPSNQPAK
jgi:hypothetical protein